MNLTGRTGNAENIATSGKLATTLLGAKNQIKFYTSYDQAEDDGNKTSNEFKAGMDLEAGFPENHSGFVRSEVEHDEIEGVDFRFTAVAGYGYYFVKNEDRQLRSRIGLEFRHENFSSGGKESNPGIELGLFNFHRFNQSLTWTSAITHSQSTDLLKDSRTTHESSIEFPLGENSKWKIQCGVLNEYDNSPAEDKERLDTKYFANFVLSWEQLRLVNIKVKRFYF